MKRILLACTLLFSFSLLAQTIDPFIQSSSYDPAIPTVESVLGYKVGEQFSPHSSLEKYYQALAKASDRVRMESYGKTYEGRALYLLTISSPKNLAQIENIRGNIAKLADPRKISAAEQKQLAENTPVIVWLGYGVHGNESNSAEAAMQVAYELAASRDPKVQDWLDHAVVLIDILSNPDGHERYVQFYKTTSGALPNSDRNAAELQERWPGGRANHYLFDLNRDWAWMTQVETVGRIAAFRKWNPQVAADLHEQGSRNTYYFAPPVKPIYEPLKALNKWFEIYGHGNAAMFDKYGFRYFTNENYDLFAPYYGDSWPSLNGAIGMTYEQAGGGGAGLAIELEDNQRLLTLKDRATHHYLTSLATIDTSVKNRVAKLNDFADFKRATIAAGRSDAMQQIFLVEGSDKKRADDIVNLLLKQGVEIQTASKEFTADDVTGYDGGKSGRHKFPEDAEHKTYIVDLAQPLGLIARALLEPEAKLETPDTYDITAWSLPYAMGVEAYYGKAAKFDGVNVTGVDAPAGGLKHKENAAVYLLPWEQSAAVPFLGHLLNEDFKAYVSIKPFKNNGKDYAAGTVIIPVETNSSELAARLAYWADRDHATVIGSPSNLSDSGVDLGSNLVRFVRKPRIAVLMDSPVNSNEYGAIWHLLDQKLNLPFTPIKVESIGGTDLNQYNVLVVPDDGREGNGYTRALNADKLSDWVSHGGTLIGIRGGAIYMTKRKSGLTGVTYKFIPREEEEARIESERANKKPGDNDEPAPSLSADEKKKQAEEKLKRKLWTWEDKEKDAATDQIPGTIMRALADRTHPLAYGVPEPLAVLDRTSPILDLSDKGDNVIYFPKDSIKLSGFVTEENEKRLALTAFAIKEYKGRGSIILFADNPVFRGFWTGTERLLTNAIFFGNISDPKVR